MENNLSLSLKCHNRNIFNYKTFDIWDTAIHLRLTTVFWFHCCGWSKVRAGSKVDLRFSTYGSISTEIKFSIQASILKKSSLLRERNDKLCRQDQVNNANSAFIFMINLLIIQGCLSGSVGQVGQVGLLVQVVRVVQVVQVVRVVLVVNVVQVVTVVLVIKFVNVYGFHGLNNQLIKKS